MNENIAEGVGILGDDNVRPLMYSGHCYYVRKCITGDQYGDFWEREVGGIAIPSTVAEYSTTVEVLAKGVRVGARATKIHCNKYGNRPRHIVDNVRIGDRLFCPNRGLGIQISPFTEDEFFIEECVPLGIWRGDTLKPIGDQILIEPTGGQIQDQAGILELPDKPKDRWSRGRVVDIGTGTRDDTGKIIPFDVNNGDIIEVSSLNNDKGTIDGKSFRILRTEDLLGIVYEDS